MGDAAPSTRVDAQLAVVALNALFWLTPPGATAPTLSLLWGGGLYLAVAGALVREGQG